MKPKSTQSKLIISQNKEAIDDALHSFERKAWLLNLFLDRMAGKGFPLTTADQVSSVLAMGTEKYVRTKTVNSVNLEIAGIKLSKAAMFDVIEIPDISEIISVERMLKEYHYILMSSLEFKDGRFRVSEREKDSAIAQFTTYAKNEKEMALFKEAKKVVDAINKWHKKYGPTLNPNGSSDRAYHPFSTPESILFWDHSNWEYKVDVTAILNNSETVIKARD